MPPLPRLIFDSHLDLAWSAVFYNRDLTQPLDALRAVEAGMTDVRGRGGSVLCLPELRRAGVAVCVATLLARSGPAAAQTPQPERGYARTDLDYAAPSLAHAAAHAQLAYYRLLEAQGHVRIIRAARELDEHWRSWIEKREVRNEKREEDAIQSAIRSPQSAIDSPPLGLILSMEGTDPITHPDQAREWHAAGLRAAGLAHYGRGQHAFGTGVDGPLAASGIELLRVMDDLGMILDVTHLCDLSMKQALDYFDGPILASHHNCRALVPGDRQLSDEQIKEIVRRGGVIGAALDAWMLHPNWVRGQTKPDVVPLAAVADHIDHVCQLAGDAKHAALGTDLDGGFGNEQAPRELRVYGDLQQLAEILANRGYADGDVDAIFHRNWLEFFRRTLP
ncbi:MAG: peptidase [Phycisphaerales bacterium]|nr:peptidase [Phycisphaerales bacterium]